MIKCKFFVSDGIFKEFQISGHAQYNVKGKDIVCAAVSTVTQHTARVLKKEGALVDIKDGYLRVWNIPSCALSQRFAAELLETLKDLTEQFSNYIHLEVNDNAH
ncbi:MAG: ribosomal-processing cysteine protease Prp [Fervidobacterium sp.]